VAEKINATEAARRFSDLVNRTRYRGESFIVVRNGEEVCRMLPPDSKVTLKDLLRILRADKPDSQFAADLAQIQLEQPPLPGSPWDL
jgi:prevent-host-death family protein